MSHAIITSFIPILDGEGDAYNGAKVYVYDAGTTNPKTIYSDAGLTTPATNPVVCNANGHHGIRYVSPGTYKIATTTSTGTPLPDYSWDNIDTGVAVGSGALPIASGGTGATTAATARTNLDVPSNATVTAIASDVANLQNSINSISGVPQGRLTLSTGVPVMTGDNVAAATVYYTPYLGAQCPIWNGSAFVLQTFAELVLSLVSNHVASTIYDLFVISDSNVIRLVSGPAWNVSTVGSGSRGSGAGTTELVQQSGILVNANAMTARYGATTVAVAAKQGTYVGSMFMDGTNGQVTCHVSFGQSRKFGIWNYYNRKKIVLQAGDGTASWTYGTNTYRPSNNSTANSLSVFVGRQEELVTSNFKQVITTSTNNTASNVAIGFNSTTAAVSGGMVGSLSLIGFTGGSSDAWMAEATYEAMMSIGAQTLTALEKATGNFSFGGGSSNMLLRAEYQG